MTARKPPKKPRGPRPPKLVLHHRPAVNKRIGRRPLRQVVSPQRWWFTIVAPNGRTLAHSEQYARAESALKAMRIIARAQKWQVFVPKSAEAAAVRFGRFAGAGWNTSWVKAAA